MTGSRALVLGGGGVTGIAWELGVLTGLADAGVRLDLSDRIVGTSAGAIVGAHLALGLSAHAIAAQQAAFETLGRVDLGVVWPLLAAQLTPDRAGALRWLGRRASRLNPHATPEFVARLTRIAPGTPWPQRLVVTALDASTGRGRVLDHASGVDLATAVAASSAVPGVFPPVVLDGVPHLDGGLRTPVNADLAAGYGRVIALAPLLGSRALERRPLYQLRALHERVAWLLVHPDAASRRAIGRDVLDAARVPHALEAGRRQALAVAAVALRVWGAAPAYGQRAASDSTAREASTANARAMPA